MSELEQWCEIDGHAWRETYLEMGLVLGPKFVHGNEPVCAVELPRYSLEMLMKKLLSPSLKDYYDSY